MILVQKIVVLIMARMLKMVCKPFVHVCSIVQSCPTLCDPMDCSPSGSSVHGILQARILEWVAMPSSSCDIKTPRMDAMKEEGELNSSQEPEDQSTLSSSHS